MTTTKDAATIARENTERMAQLVHERAAIDREVAAIRAMQAALNGKRRPARGRRVRNQS